MRKLNLVIESSAFAGCYMHKPIKCSILSIGWMPALNLYMLVYSLEYVQIHGMECRSVDHTTAIFFKLNSSIRHYKGRGFTIFFVYNPIVFLIQTLHAIEFNTRSSYKCKDEVHFHWSFY